MIQGSLVKNILSILHIIQSIPLLFFQEVDVFEKAGHENLIRGVLILLSNFKEEISEE